MRTFWLRLLDVFVRGRREHRLAAEIQSHLDLLIEEHMARGLSREDATLAARKSFGGVDQVKERYRDQRGLPLLDVLLQDVRFSCRLMRKNAAFSLTAAGSLALSIGALTLAFAAVNAIVFKPLPIADPASVYFMQNGNVGWSYPDYRDLRDRLDVEALAGYRISMMNVGLEPEPAILWGYLATGNYFDALGITPAAGRFFTASEDSRPGDAPLAVLAYHTWQSRFAGRSDVIGHTLMINGRPFTVIGVAPRGFHGTEMVYRPEIWVPMSMQAQIELGSTWLERRETQNVMVITRLRAHTRREASEAAIAAAVAQLSKEHPRNGPLQLRLTRPGLFGDGIGGPARVFVWGLFGLGVLLMLAGCSNLAGLLLARGNDRAHEIALRTALGAGKARIARQLLTESVMLAVCGGLGGAAIAWIGTRIVSTWRLPTELPVQLDLNADVAVWMFATGAAVVVGLIVGVAPARFATRLDLSRSLKSSAGFAIGGRRLQGREILVCLQVAFCVVLLHASFLAVRGLQRAATASIGWNPNGLVMAATELGLARYSAEQSDAYRARVVEAARALPGIVSVTTSNSMPLHIDQSATSLFTYPASEPERGLSASFYNVSPAYFATLQIPLRDGRDFNEFDTRVSPPVAIVNRAIADRLFEGNAIGKQLRSGRGGTPMQIVGVVEDGKYTTLSESRRGAIFRPLSQTFATSSMLIVRAATPGAVRTDDLEKIIHRIDASLPIRSSATGEQLTALPLFPYRFAVAAIGLLGLIASGLLLSGLHAMLAYAVVKRQREIGIRVALGADRSSVIHAVLSRVFVILAIGLGLGALLSSGTGPMVSSLVLGVSPAEPVIVLAIVGLLALIALLSCAGPVRRSLRVDPLVALRED
jgi:macrolide transport system ATP-binding/permease protein